MHTACQALQSMGPIHAALLSQLYCTLHLHTPICVNSILCLFSIYHQYVCSVIFCKTSHRDEQALQAPCRTNIHHIKSASSHQIASKQKQSRVYTHHIRACHSAMHDSCKSRYTSLNTKGKLGEEEGGGGWEGAGGGGGFTSPKRSPASSAARPMFVHSCRL